MRKTYKTILFILFYTINIFGQNWQSYPYSPAGTVLSFPVDDGKHTSASTSTEWWYTNLHVIGSAPNYRVYDVMLCYFNKPAKMRIFNIAVPSLGIFHTNVINLAAPLALSAQTGHWELTYTVSSPSIHDTSKWTFPNSGIPYQYRYHTENPTNNDGLDVTVTSNRPPLNVGGDGYMPIGKSGDSSFYYSYTNMKVDGTIKFGGTIDTISSGIAWIDRQWGPFTVGINTTNKYEWYSMQLDKPGITWGIPQTPSEFNIWQIFSGANDVPYDPSSRLVSGIYPDGSQDTTSNYIFERTSYWYDQSNSVYYSSGWRLINPLRNINLDMSTTIPNQVINVTFFKFWEGATKVKGVVENQNVEGIGFAELVQTHASIIETPSTPTGLSITSDTDHNTISWSSSTMGTYPIGGYRVYRSSTNKGYWKYLATTSNLYYDDFAAIKDSAYFYTVTSFDNQTATSASNYATPVQVGIKEVSAFFSSIRIYPNPTNDKFTVNCAENQNLILSLYNIIGHTILQKKLNKIINEIDISSLKKGMYIIKINDGQLSIQQKLIKK